MHPQRYDEYIRRFNEQDFTAFDDFLTPDMHMQNGGLKYRGVQAMKDHYAKIWGKFKETLTVQRFVSDETSLAVHLRARFDVLVDDPAALFGSVRKGEVFEYDGVIMYEIENGKFKDIKVAYLSFTRTDLNGVEHSLGLAH